MDAARKATAEKQDEKRDGKGDARQEDNSEKAESPSRGHLTALSTPQSITQSRNRRTRTTSIRVLLNI